jgi:hypothetical protein
VGKALTEIYYSSSPPVADFVARHAILRTVVLWSLLPIVGASWLALKIGLAPALVLAVLFLAVLCAVVLALYRKCWFRVPKVVQKRILEEEKTVKPFCLQYV